MFQLTVEHVHRPSLICNAVHYGTLPTPNHGVLPAKTMITIHGLRKIMGDSWFSSWMYDPAMKQHTLVLPAEHL